MIRKLAKLSWKQTGAIKMMDFRHIQKRFEQHSLKQFSLKSYSLPTTLVFLYIKNTGLTPRALAALLTIYKWFTDWKWKI